MAWGSRPDPRQKKRFGLGKKDILPWKKKKKRVVIGGGRIGRGPKYTYRKKKKVTEQPNLKRGGKKPQMFCVQMTKEPDHAEAFGGVQEHVQHGARGNESKGKSISYFQSGGARLQEAAYINRQV